MDTKQAGMGYLQSQMNLITETYCWNSFPVYVHTFELTDTYYPFNKNVCITYADLFIWNESIVDVAQVLVDKVHNPIFHRVGNVYSDDIYNWMHSCHTY